MRGHYFLQIELGSKTKPFAYWLFRRKGVEEPKRLGVGGVCGIFSPQPHSSTSHHRYSKRLGDIARTIRPTFPCGKEVPIGFRKKRETILA